MLEFGELGREDSDDLAVGEYGDSLCEAEQAQDVFGGGASTGTHIGVQG